MSFFAFKGFDKDLKCRGFQYEVGKTYSMPEKPEICERGFHCCTKLSDVFQYYVPWTWDREEDRVGYLLPAKRWPSDNRYCLVEVCGDIDTDRDAFGNSSKIATNSITIIQELSLEDVINILEAESDEAKRAFISIEGIADELKRVHRLKTRLTPPPTPLWPRGTM